MYYNAHEELFELVEIFDKLAILSDCRIDRDTIPEGLYVYDVRHDDSGDICSIENRVVVNFYGTIICKEPIDVPDGGLDVTDEDFGYLDIDWALDRYTNTDLHTTKL